MSDIDHQDLCPSCGCVTDLDAPCRRCGLDLEAGDPRAPRLAGLPWRKIGLALGLLLAAAWWWRPIHFPLDALVPTAEAAEAAEAADVPAPCEGAERCIVAYVTPWCPACRQSAGVIHAMQERYEDRDDVRVAVVVGQDAPSKLERTA